ncbi:VTT domain-containing protein [Ectobacillus sp. JY-23]|uniref:TVP38/TMEM64 family protein n=1 Tax=Ectobacillus sp. JY-23 TaxID=2933872 RepID=UPI001FF43CD4|nr:VTT domain-containing protein [Ectobacillus sp. JY-23]UOY92354.1 VTT domain-containing protein [Ectobacillus sp. JY-23]
MQLRNHFSFFYTLFAQIFFLVIPLIILVKWLPTLLPVYKMIGIIFVSGISLFALIAFILKQNALYNLFRIISIYFFVAVIAVFLTYLISSFIVITDAKGLETIFREHMSFAKLMYFAICFAQPLILPLPEAVTVVAGSTVLGSFTAFFLGFLGSVAGIVTMFFISRIGGMKLVKRLVNEKQLQQYHQFLEKNEVLILIVLFVIPILPDEVICAGAGISGVKVRRFLLIAILSKAITSFSLAYSTKIAEAFSLSAFQLTVFTSLAVLLVMSMTWIVKKVFK